MTVKYILGQTGENGKPRTIVIEEGTKPLHEKLDAHSPHWKMTNTINTLIDHLTDYEVEQDRRYTELDNRIQTIANNQLKMKRGEVPAFECNDCSFGKPCEKHSAPEQPKRWRANFSKYERYFFVRDNGDTEQIDDAGFDCDDYRYNTGNYHQTREAAEAYKARLLELGQQV